MLWTMRKPWLWLSLILSACSVDSIDGNVETSSTEQAITSANRLASNRLASNRLASNRLASNGLGAAALTATELVETEDGREVFSYIVSCALPDGASVTVQDQSGTSYTFGGSLGLAPDWASQTPTVADRRWVSACLLARTNYFGVSVLLSMRGSLEALETTADERSAYPVLEGAFYGDLFEQTSPTWHACGTSTEPVHAQRLCTIAPDGVTTMCGFTYTGMCSAACASGDAPWASCAGSDTSWYEVITVYLQST